MAIHQVDSDFYFIERGMLTANHLVYAGENPLLIDSGHPTSVADTKALIEQTGVELKQIKTIINTHTHADHVGANAALQQISNCQIGLHEYGHYFVKQKMGYFLGWRYEDVDFFRADIALTEGQVLEFGNYYFQILHTPGHAFDGIVLYEPDRQWLISGDALWEQDLAAINQQKQGAASLFEVQKTLNKLSKLSVKRVFPGHGKAFEDFGKAIDKSQQKLERYLNNPKQLGKDFIKKVLIYSLLKGGQPAEDHYDKISRLDWFRDTVDLHFPEQGAIIYQEIVGKFLERGILVYQNGLIATTIQAG